MGGRDKSGAENPVPEGQMRIAQRFNVGTMQAASKRLVQKGRLTSLPKVPFVVCCLSNRDR